MSSDLRGPQAGSLPIRVSAVVAVPVSVQPIFTAIPRNAGRSPLRHSKKQLSSPPQRTFRQVVAELLLPAASTMPESCT